MNTCLLQGRCVGQGTYSDLANSGLDVQSLVSLPESEGDSAIEADDIEVEEKEKGNTTQTTAVKATVKSPITVCRTFMNYYSHVKNTGSDHDHQVSE